MDTKESEQQLDTRTIELLYNFAKESFATYLDIIDKLDQKNFYFNFFRWNNHFSNFLIWSKLQKFTFLYLHCLYIFLNANWNLRIHSKKSIYC
jgi:hypothetical protein